MWTVERSVLVISYFECLYQVWHTVLSIIYSSMHVVSLVFMKVIIRFKFAQCQSLAYSYLVPQTAARLKRVEQHVVH